MILIERFLLMQVVTKPSLASLRVAMQLVKDICFWSMMNRADFADLTAFSSVEGLSARSSFIRNCLSLSTHIGARTSEMST